MNLDFEIDNIRFNARASALYIIKIKQKFYYLRLLIEIILCFQVEE